MPKISVILPVYNNGAYIAEAVNSILRQTYRDFEILILNDGSTDNTENALNSIKDSRIKVYNNRTNNGLVWSLNKGLVEARGKYIARMDADDISLPNRFAKQLYFLEENPNISAIGSQIYIFPENRGGKTWVRGFSPEEIKVYLLFQNAICHPSIMLRKEVLIGNNICYRKEYHAAEDYKLWTEITRIGKIINTKEVLLNYRIHNEQVSYQQKEMQIETMKRIWIEQLKLLSINPTIEEIRIHLSFLLQTEYSFNYKKKLNLWVEKLKEANNDKKVYNNSVFNSILSDYTQNATDRYNFAFNTLPLKRKIAFYVNRRAKISHLF